jgi:hypothetical protein
LKNSFTVILAIFLIICSNGTQAQTSETTIKKINQEFKGSASGTFGFIGSMKIRLQYELLFKKIPQPVSTSIIILMAGRGPYLNHL